MLPDALPVSALPGAAQTGTQIPFGIDEDTLSPVLLDFSADPHLLVFGDTECGKSNLLRLIAESIVERYTPDQARLIFIDYRRSLLDAAETEHRIGYAASSTAAAQLINDVREALMKRLPPPDLTPDQLRNRSWWNGLGPVPHRRRLRPGRHGSANPLLRARRPDSPGSRHRAAPHHRPSAGGAGRSLFDPVIQRIKEMGSPGLIMSGNKDEGALFGSVKAQPQPPGRGFFVERRAGSQLVQVALLDDGTMPPTGQHHASSPAAPNGHGAGVPAGHGVQQAHG